MMKRTCISFLIVATISALAFAQSSMTVPPKDLSPNAPRSVTRPLTPQSPLAAKHKKQSVVARASKSAESTNAQLRHLEEQNPVGPASKTRTAPSKAISPTPSTNKPERSPDINFTYQKPTGSKSGAAAAVNSNSTTPQIKKN
jgi:hypothetical protein